MHTSCNLTQSASLSVTSSLCADTGSTHILLRTSRRTNIVRAPPQWSHYQICWYMSVRYPQSPSSYIRARLDRHRKNQRSTKAPAIIFDSDDGSDIAPTSDDSSDTCPSPSNRHHIGHTAFRPYWSISSYVAHRRPIHLCFSS